MTKSTNSAIAETAIRRVWKSAQMFVGFHRDQSGKDRVEPKLWPPKNGSASIHDNPKAQEAVVVVKASDPKDTQDIEIKMHPNRIIVRLETDKWWQGVAVEEDTIRVRMADGTYITIEYDGRIKRYGHNDHTYVEADGSIFKHTAHAESHMTGDGVQMTCGTADRIASITRGCVVDRGRKG
ncbi:hypothetical protein [Ruegeria sp. Alg231-54]|uniref:hypothetical protein n=1 Tax=Ruegeria sp. Alg231-54 TaxID=1922221 RepID=UPI000D556A3C|nr:hypothetical protein [Ruegeria sp. Alg231-54]